MSLLEKLLSSSESTTFLEFWVLIDVPMCLWFSFTLFVLCVIILKVNNIGLVRITSS